MGLDDLLGHTSFNEKNKNIYIDNQIDREMDEQIDRNTDRKIEKQICIIYT